MVKFLKQFFWKILLIMDNLLDRRVEVIFCIKLLLLHKTFKIKNMVEVCSIHWLCTVKNSQNWPLQVERSKANPTKLFSVDFYDLNTRSFKFGNDIFTTFEMPGSSYKMPFWKIIIPLLFRLFAPDVLVLAKYPPRHDYRTPHTWF